MKKVLELARRSLSGDQPPRAVEVLAREDPGLYAGIRSRGADHRDAARPGAASSAATGLPEVWNRGILSFYDLPHGLAEPTHCCGMACRFPEGAADGPGAAAQPLQRHGGEAYCLGRCYEAPASTETVAAPIPRRSLSGEPVVLRHLLGGPGAVQAAVWTDYELADGETVLDAVIASGLRGRGGAAYPTGAKWKVARDTPARDRYVVANGDEGDPGAYIDRLLLEEAPHSVLAGVVACGRAIGATRGVVYVRAEYPLAAQRVREAVAEAQARGVLGDMSISVVVGAGCYVAGEENALLRSIEGLRAEPSPKPPYPAQSGLYGLPTVVQNIETLSVVPWVVAGRRGVRTKAVCLSGAIARPGVVEVDLGTSLRTVLEQGGGGPARGRHWKMALVGGPLGRVVGADDFDIDLSFEALPGMGHAGVVVFDESVSARALAEHLFAFARSQSCGTCAPCRIGSVQLASRRTIADLDRLMLTLEQGSLCGFGQGIARPIRDLLRLYGEEVLAAPAPAWHAATGERNGEDATASAMSDVARSGAVPGTNQSHAAAAGKAAHSLARDGSASLRLNGRDVAGGGSVLDACRREGVAVATLCHDDRVAAGGHCRACLVEVDGHLQPACTTPAADGAVIETASADVREYLRDLGELIAADSSPRGATAALLAEWGVDGSRYERAARAAGPLRDDGHPFVRLDTSACILCRLCVRVCAEVQGQFVFAVEGRGAEAHVAWGNGAFSDTACVACGACAAACPSGAISDVDRDRTAKHCDTARRHERDGAATGEARGTTLARSPGDRVLPILPISRVVRTTCAYCGVGCQLDVAIGADGDIAFVEGAASKVNNGHLCVKGRYAHTFAHHPERLMTPLLRRGKHLMPVSWNEALAYVAAGLERHRGRSFVVASSRCTNEESYLLQKWARAGLHTNNVDCCARVCHAPSAAGMRRSFGTGAATNSFADIEVADLLFVCGANATEGHPVVGARIRQAVLGGARLVVVDPRRTELAALADVHLAPRLGTNVPLLNSLAAVIVEEGLVDRDFVQRRTAGFDELARFVPDYRPEAVEAITGVPARDVRAAARLVAGARAPMQLHGLGVTEHLQGSEAVILLCNLALLCGAVGREGVGVNPLRGQNNVQGAVDMGCQPDVLPGYAPVIDAAARARFEEHWQRPLPSMPGLTLPRAYEAIARGGIRAMFIAGQNLVQTDPDAQRVRESLANLELLVVQDIFLTETARMAHVVLPAGSALEKDGTFTSGERRVQRVRRVLAPPGQARADWQILCDLMKACGLPADYTSPREIFDEVRALVPALAGADYDAIDVEGLQWPVTAAAPRGTAILHRDSFSGAARAPLHCIAFTPSPALQGDSLHPLRLTTGRVLEHYNSGSMTRRSGALRLVCADFLQIHPDDARARGVADGDAVMIASSFGEAAAVAAVTDVVPPGTLFLSFHFPETGTNAVTSDVVDRLTDCPEYKVTAVEVRRAE